MKQIEITISSRNYPGCEIMKTIEFNSIKEFFEKVDEECEDTDFGKVNVTFKDDTNLFDDNEVNLLGKNWIFKE